MTGVPASAANGSSGAQGATSDVHPKAPDASSAPSASVDVPPTVSGVSPGGSSPAGSPSAASSPVGSAPAGPVGSPGEPGGFSDDGGDSGPDGVQGGARPARGAKVVAAAVNQASVWNIANLLTMLRLVLVPGFVALMLADGGYDPAWRAFAWAAFAVAMITDLFDGHLARAYDLVTDFGKIADPIADKAIMGAALVCLSALGDLPWWVTIVILGRELGITLMRFLVIRYGVIPASRGGKLKTLTQGVAVGMYVLPLTEWLATLRFWVMAAAVVLTVVTGLDYVKQAIVLRRQGIAARAAASEETEA
ncbi:MULTISPECIES: CDP-diacylglycerol--glycerol-3-phosphate 3-phosphatidyltransferase [unclassified Streptomyces]|uniref:CDP-diacylglycerol--glycerol-3-phosphate 3-phosphatidyltransferase n=1 Tax=unclassified Streptomyces TaxID=2593676 RepID=UPI00380D920D